MISNTQQGSRYKTKTIRQPEGKHEIERSKTSSRKSQIARRSKEKVGGHVQITKQKGVYYRAIDVFISFSGIHNFVQLVGQRRRRRQLLIEGMVKKFHGR